MRQREKNDSCFYKFIFVVVVVGGGGGEEEEVNAGVGGSNLEHGGKECVVEMRPSALLAVGLRTEAHLQASIDNLCMQAGKTRCSKTKTKISFHQL
jgi:hypothetical protein